MVVLLSCDNKSLNTATDETLHFDVSQWKKNQVISKDILNQVDFIPLETTKDNLIGQINKLQVYEDHYYILDIKYVKKILVHNKNGDFIRSIGNIGRGADEYISLNDFLIDEHRNHLLILDSQLRKVLAYSIEDGSYVYDFKIDFWASNFALLDDNTIVFYSKEQNPKGDSKYSIAKYNLRNNKYQWLLEKDEYDTRLSKFFSFFSSKNLYYTPYLKDVVYQISEKSIRPYATFNFGRNKVPSEELKRIKDSNPRGIIDLMGKSHWTYGINNFIENDEFIVFNLNIERQHTFVVYSKESGECMYGNKYEGALSNLRFIGHNYVDNNNFLSIVDASSFRKLRSKIMEYGDEKLIKHYMSILNMISSQSNPVIMSIEYNNF